MTETHSTLRRDPSFFGIPIVGAGIFVLTGIAVGMALILYFALNGLITVFTAMVHAEPGSAIPEAGQVVCGCARGCLAPTPFRQGG